MTKFDMSSAWDDAMLLLRSDLALTSALVGALVLLPGLAYLLIGPVPVAPAPGASFDQVMATLRADLSQSAPIILLMALLSSLAAVAVSRLWLAPSGTSVSDAVGFAAALLPSIIILFVIQMLALGLAALAFIVPMLYLAGRWAPTVAVLAAGETRSPVAALKRAWDMTRGNGWRIFLMIVLVQIVVVILTMIIDGVTGMFGARGSVGYAVASLINSAVGAGGALISIAVGTAIYRQLSQTMVARAFD